MPAPAQRAAAWLSCDLARLAVELPHFAAQDADLFHFDVVIVGSGYGGAMVLQALAGHGHADGTPLRIAMLERGQEYLPGSFPSRLAELPGHVRFSARDQGRLRGRETGLFDVRLGPDMGVVVASGLGGGSLINAGVMAAPLPQVFAEPAWPTAIRENPRLAGLLRKVRSRLEANTTIPSASGRTQAMDKLSLSEPAAVTVAAQANPARGIHACVGCGDCATGCNFGAKVSVDVGPIARAARRHPRDALRIVTGASVRTFRRGGEGWILSVDHTDGAVRRRQGEPHEIRTRRLILCAGTLGSTELLLRAAEDGLDVSRHRLGEQFSGNGDNIVMLHGIGGRTSAVADEAQPFAQRKHGPTITRIIDLRRGSVPMVIQDLAIPGALRRLMEEVAAFGGTMDALAKYDDREHGTGQPSSPGPEELSTGTIERSLALAVIARDAATGRLVLAENAEPGTLGVNWPEARNAPELDVVHQQVEELARTGHPEASLLANPSWRPLSRTVERLVGRARGPLLTVHPLGGCAMADAAEDGVVNHLGQVFRGSRGTDVYQNLVILDGSIVPTSLGINPSLTIAALAHRAASTLRGLWGFRRMPAEHAKVGPRPLFRTMPPAQQVVPTLFQVTEQMNADATLKLGSTAIACKVALELWSRPFTLGGVARDTSRRVLRLDPQRSRLRIIQPAPVAGSETVPFVGAAGPQPPNPRETVLYEARLGGTMSLFEHEESTPLRRALRAGLAYVLNRGLRDWWQSVFGKGQTSSEASIVDHLRLGWHLASRAGDRRVIAYHLRVRPAVPPAQALFDGSRLVGARLALRKVLTYECAANPAVQLMEAKLEGEFPGAPGLRVDRSFRVDLPYFGRMGAPLLRIHDQQDHARALVDTVSLLAYIGRTLLPLHAWTFRLPDPPTRPLPPDPRLPGRIPGIAAPSVTLLPVARNAYARLAYYARKRGAPAQPRPVLLIHGYSASGTTFAHEALPGGGLAGELCRRGHDVWVLDLRSSSGLATATHPWTFEQMGCLDIPAAVGHIHRRYGGAKVDVVAHCMGAAMLSLGLFGDWNEPAYDLYKEDRDAMPERIHSLVLSQVGPALVMSPANTARAYLAQWLQQFFTLGHFAFRPSNPRTDAEGLLDRLLCAVPYPRRDFRRENPIWPWKTTPWVAQRHRMDAFFGITFDLQGVSDAVLERIDEFFGPMHLSTVAQTVWFARSHLVTDRNGSKAVVDPNRMKRIGHCRVLALHSEWNGLVDVSTRETLLAMFWPKISRGKSVLLERMGHQDSLIGRNAPKVYACIGDFLGG